MLKYSFYPWVGPLYLTQGFLGKKILVLGESFYCGECPKEECGLSQDGGCSEWFIDEFLHRALSECKYQKTYCAIGRMFCALLSSDKLQTYIWRRISFYNYVQRSVANKARVSPAKEDFENDNQKFAETIDVLNPDIIIALGKRLWNNIPENENWQRIKTVEISSETISEVWYYKKHVAFWVYHPSHAKFEEYLDSYVQLLKEMIEGNYDIRRLI